MSTIHIQRAADLIGKRVAIPSMWPGMAFHVRRLDVERVPEWVYDGPDDIENVPADFDPDDFWFFEEIDVPSGLVVVVAVGDDTERWVDPSECAVLDDDEFCPCCGSTDCGWRA